MGAYSLGNIIRYRVYQANDPTPSWTGANIAVTLGVGNNPNWLRLRSDDAGNLVLGIETVNEGSGPSPTTGARALGAR